jgi:hypothetical protein
MERLNTAEADMQEFGEMLHEAYRRAQQEPFYSILLVTVVMYQNGDHSISYEWIPTHETLNKIWLTIRRLKGEKIYWEGEQYGRRRTTRTARPRRN